MYYCLWTTVRVFVSTVSEIKVYIYIYIYIYIWPKCPFFLAETSTFSGRNVHLFWPKRPSFWPKRPSSLAETSIFLGRNVHPFGRNVHVFSGRIGSWPKCPVTVQTHTVIQDSTSQVFFFFSAGQRFPPHRRTSGGV